jgi:hypothetical protein
MEAPLIILFIGGFFLVVGLFIFAVYKYEKARTEQFQAVSDELGLQFHPKGDPAFQSSISHHRLFNQGHSRRTKNMIFGQTEDIELAIFGYRYTTGSGKHQQTHQQTVISIQSPHLALPEFELRPENFLHKIGKVFGFTDVNFDSHPLFSKRFLLRGSDVAAIRDLFTSELLEYFETQEGVSVEATKDGLIFYRASKRIKPTDVRAFMEEGFRVYGILRQPEA